ncbi:S-layer homology domain-containing protein [Paenibacillus sp. 1P07SE]|uniref:S-layer homology domain-containing protein n=1 Tax=Paenibacillus sp. 1P07SE TaxID=3132209 RepID=UPI0039A696F0
MQTIDGARTLTNEFHVEVAHEPMPGGEDEYDESNVNQASPYDVLQGLRFEQKQYILDELYIQSGSSLNLYRDLKVRGVYDNLLNSTLLTSQVVWSLEQDPGEPVGELVMNSQNQPVLRFIGQNAELTEGTVVIRATYNDISHAIPVHFVQPEELVIEPAALKLLPDETLHLRDHVRARLTGTYEGNSYSLDASARVDWSVPAQYQSLVELDGNLVSFPSAENGDAVALAAAYDAEVQLQAELAIEIVPSLQLGIDPALAQDYHNDLLGYNDNRWGVNASRYTEQDIIDLTMPLKPAYIRFPGGSRGNYYQWQIEGYIPHILSNPNDLASYQNMIDDPYSQGIISIDDFIAYTDEVGAEPIVQLNPYTADVDSAVGFLEYTMQQGYEVKYWEIGNELSYLGGAGAPYRVAFPTVEDYIRKAKEFALALKAVDPTINIIVVGPKFFSVYGDEPDNEFNRDWAEKLGQEDFYEIVVYHLYWQNLYDVAEVDYFEEIHIGMRRAQPQIEDMARALQHYFPGKQAAITEWGILRDNTRVSKTLFNVLYDAESILNFIQYDNITITNRHVLATNQYELIGYTGTPASNSHDATIRAPYYAFQLLAELFEQSDQRIEAAIAGGKQLVPDEYEHGRMIPELLTTAFRDSATGKLFVAAVNKSGLDKPIDVHVENDNRQYRAEMSYITGETIVDDQGDNRFTLQNNNGGVKYRQADFLADIPMDKTQHVYTRTQSYEANESWIIPRYSVAVLELIEVGTDNPGPGQQPGWSPSGLPSNPPSSTPQGMLDASALKTQLIANETDRMLLRAEADALQLEAAIKQLEMLEDKRLTIALTANGSDLELVLPLQQLAEGTMAAPSLELSIEVDGVHYVLPLAAWDLTALLEQGGDAAEAATLTVKIGQAPDNVKQQLQAAAEEAGGELLLPGTSFEVRADTGTGSFELQPGGGEYVERRLQLPDTVDMFKAAGVWLDPASGELAFVPTVFELQEGAHWARMLRPGNSVYTVLQLERAYADLAGHWAQREIEQLASKLIVKGRTGHVYAPGDAVTRAEFAALLVRALGLGGTRSVPLEEQPRFTDVTAGAWYAQAITDATAAGLIHGFEDGSFRPAETVSREQMALMLERAVAFAEAGLGVERASRHEQTGEAGIQVYEDAAAIADWSKAAIGFVRHRGLMDGVSDRIFDPQGETTRAQAALVIHRMLAELGFVQL